MSEPVRPKALPPIPRAARDSDSPMIVIDCVCESFSVTRDEIRYGDKRPLFAEARGVTQWLLRYVAKLTWHEVGDATNRDHTTAIAVCKRVVRRRETEPQFLAFTDELAVAVAARLKVGTKE
jgi:chromosomal replication initiation ATPase DnaA